MKSRDDHGASNQGYYDWFLLLILAVSLTANVVLAYGLVRTPAANAAGQAGKLPEVGRSLPAMNVQKLDGTGELISFERENRQTIVYVFTPSCKWCERNLANLRTLTAVAKERGVRLVGLSLDSDVNEYLREKKLDFPVYVRPDAKTLRAYGIGATPQTFVISKGGVLERIWQGAYVGANKLEVEVWLGRQLPGIETASDTGVPN